MLHKMFKWLPLHARRTVTQALITRQMDNGNGLYIGIAARLLQRHQNLQYVSARLILCFSRLTHITPHPRKLHWLPVQKRCQFKLLIHAHKALQNQGPAYINHCLNFHQLLRKLLSTTLSLAYTPRIYQSKSGRCCLSHIAVKT